MTEAGDKGRFRAESFADRYSQARQLYLSQSSYEQAHIASALVFELSKVEHLHVREAMVGHLRHVEEDLATRVAVGLALSKLPEAPPVAAPVQETKPSPALQIIGKMKRTLAGRSIAVVVADGSDRAVVERLRKAARDAGATVKIVAPRVGGVKLADGSRLVADGQLAGTPSVFFDAIAVGSGSGRSRFGRWPRESIVAGGFLKTDRTSALHTSGHNTLLRAAVSLLGVPWSMHQKSRLGSSSTVKQKVGNRQDASRRILRGVRSMGVGGAQWILPIWPPAQPGPRGAATQAADLSPRDAHAYTANI